MKNYSDDSFNENENSFGSNQENYDRDVINNKISNVNTIFNIFKYSCIAVVVSILAILPAKEFMTFGLFIIVPAVIAIPVTQLMLEYRAWDVIQDGHQARATPGEAIWKSFIPFYNIYWAYVRTVGLAKDCEKYANQKGLGDIPLNKNYVYRIIFLTVSVFLGLVFCVALIASKSVPGNASEDIADLIVALCSLIFSYLFITKVKDTTIKFLEAKANSNQQMNQEISSYFHS